MRDNEVKTDKLTIQRGYARELSANRAYRLKKSHISLAEQRKAPYLFPKEIKSYAKKTGKMVK